MNWITDDWRLKLLALGLAILMLGAVAFSQNPPTTNTLAIHLVYTTVGPDQNLVIINPPSTVNVTFLGPADIIRNATANNFSATVDATHAAPGSAVKLNVSVTPTIAVSIQNPAPIVVRVDLLKAVNLPVQAVAHPQPGWLVTNVVSSPATVNFLGPASWESNLTATVIDPTAIAGTNSTALNLPVQLQNSNGALSWTPCTTVPCATLDTTGVALTVTAKTGTTSTTVPLVAAPNPAQPPPPQYEITGVIVNPALVTIIGDPAILAKIQRITLPAVDLSGYTSTQTVQVQISYPDGVTPLNGVQTAKVTYIIQRNPAVSPSP